MRRPNTPSLALLFFGYAAAQNATTSGSSLSGTSSVSASESLVSTVLTPSTTATLSAIPSFTSAPAAISVTSFSQPSPSGIVTDTSAASIPSTSAATFATFSPVPSPSTGASIPGVFPATSPDSPPPVEGPGIVPDFSAAWAAAWSKAQDKVATLDNQQKTNLTSGQVGLTGRCVGQTGSVPGLPDTGLCLQDAPIGVRNTDFVTAFPSGFNTAASWRRSLFRARGLGIGQEHRNKGVNVALGPMMNLLRTPLAGRNWEGFGADPYLAGEAAYETILGMQAAGVQACAKHFLLNEQETFRMLISSQADDRTTHELYLIPFIRSVMAGVSSVMCSYNQLNGTYACENDRLLNGLLKNELGFQGYVMSDWLATHSTIQAVNSGLDIEMPFNIFLDGLLQIAIDLGFVAQTRLDDMVTRILAGFYLLKQDDLSYPTLNFNQNDVTDDATNEHIDVQDDHDVIVREIATSSIVMLKNNGVLPLKAPRSMAVIGSDAGPARNKGPNEFSLRMGEDGILAEGYGSGTVSMTYLISPYEVLQSRARLNRTTFEWMWDDSDTSTAASYAYQKDVAIVFIQADAGEGFDRLNMDPDNNGNALVKAVAAVNKNTIVVINSADPLILDSWIDLANVSAVLWAGVSGPEAGNAIVDVLYGVANPSGKLPFTIAKSQSDYNTAIELITVDYTEALNIDYRHFDSAGIEPRFEFGFGLSYTTYAYSDLSITAVPGGDDNDTEIEATWASGLPTPNGVGSSTALWLHRPAYQVSFTVTNTGDVPGTEIAQLYLNHPSSAGEPPSILKGFADVTVVPGASETVTLLLSRFDLSIWDVVSQSWVKPSGSYGITIGASSRDARLNVSSHHLVPYVGHPSLPSFAVPSASSVRDLHGGYPMRGMSGSPASVTATLPPPAILYRELRARLLESRSRRLDAEARNAQCLVRIDALERSLEDAVRGRDNAMRARDAASSGLRKGAQVLSRLQEEYHAMSDQVSVVRPLVDLLDCGICQEKMLDAFVLPNCGHVCCRGCLLSWMCRIRRDFWDTYGADTSGSYRLPVRRSQFPRLSPHVFSFISSLAICARNPSYTCPFCRSEMSLPPVKCHLVSRLAHAVSSARDVFPDGDMTDLSDDCFSPFFS